MARAYGLDLRRRVVEAIDGGLSARRAAAQFSVGISTAINWHRQWREEGSLEPGRQGKPRRSKLDPYEAFILGLVDEKHDIALHETAEKLAAERGVQTCPATVWYFFSKRGLTHKKKTGHATEQQRPDVLARRRVWFDRQIDLDPERLIFIDETGANTKMARIRGWAPRGERCRASVPHGHWKTTTLTAGLRLNGLAAPMLLDRPVHGDAFRAMSSKSWYPNSAHETSWSWTISPPTRLPESARLLKTQEHACCSCLPIVPTLIPSKWRSRNSRHYCAKRQREPSMSSGLPSPIISTPSHRQSAKTISLPQDMTRNNLNLL